MAYKKATPDVEQPIADLQLQYRGDTAPGTLFEEPQPQRFYQSMLYSVINGGKRIRSQQGATQTRPAPRF